MGRITLKKYSGYILIAPALMPFFLAFLVLPDAVIGYYHFLKHDIFPLRHCTISETGHLVAQDDPQSRYYHATGGIPCINEPIHGFRPIGYFQQFYALCFLEAALLIFAGSVVLFIFSKKRPDLAAKGLLP